MEKRYVMPLIRVEKDSEFATIIAAVIMMMITESGRGIARTVAARGRMGAVAWRYCEGLSVQLCKYNDRSRDRKG